MSHIFNKLNSIKDKLANLEMNFETEVKKEEQVNHYKNRIDKKLPYIVKNQTSKIKFDIGGEAFIVAALSTIMDFPFTLTLKQEITNNSSSKPIFLDSSRNLFSAVINIIRNIATEPIVEGKRKLIINCSVEALQAHSKEYFLEDTEKVLNQFDFQYDPPWVKKEKSQKPKKDIKKWGKGEYILCYACGQQNDGTFWRKRCSYDRNNDSYCIDFYIATCLNCDPDNTLTY